MTKLNIRKTFDQWYRDKMTPADESAVVAPEIVLGLIQQMTDVDMMYVEEDWYWQVDSFQKDREDAIRDKIFDQE